MDLASWVGLRPLILLLLEGTPQGYALLHVIVAPYIIDAIIVKRLLVKWALDSTIQKTLAETRTAESVAAIQSQWFLQVVVGLPTYLAVEYLVILELLFSFEWVLCGDVFH